MLVLETPRLNHFKLTEADAAFALELLNDPTFLDLIGDRGVRDLEDATQYLVRGPIQSYALNGHSMYRVELKSTGEHIGMCGLITREGLHYVDIGFAFLPKFRNQGYATESAVGVLEYGRKNLGLKKIVGITNPRNLISIRILEKIGLRFEGEVMLPRQGEWVNLYGVSFPEELP